MDDYYNATDLLSDINPNFSSFYFVTDFKFQKSIALNNMKQVYDFKDYCNYFLYY